MMEKHSKKYAEKLANEYAKDACGPYAEFQPLQDLGIDMSLLDLTSQDFTRGYQKAIEETNVKELREALENLVNECELEGWWDYDNDIADADITRAKEALNKAK